MLSTNYYSSYPVIYTQASESSKINILVILDKMLPLSFPRSLYILLVYLRSKYTRKLPRLGHSLAPSALSSSHNYTTILRPNTLKPYRAFLNFSLPFLTNSYLNPNLNLALPMNSLARILIKMNLLSFLSQEMCSQLICLAHALF